jgi:hypothetical protein
VKTVEMSVIGVFDAFIADCSFVGGAGTIFINVNLGIEKINV